MRSLTLEQPAWRGRLVLLLALSALLLIPAGGSGSLERAEVYFMDGARAMLESGNWLVPHYRGEPFFDKPPLVYWLIAGSFSLFGATPAAARLVPALCALGAILATVWLAAIVAGRSAALLAGVVLATTLPFLVFGHTAMADMPMTLVTTLAIAIAARAWQDPRLAWPVPAVGALLGIALLTKGPIGVLLPSLALVALAWSRRRASSPLTGPRLAAACLLALTIGASWFVAIALTLGPEPLEYFFLRENLQRFAGATYDAGRGPLFYVGTYLVQAAPWSFFFPVAVVRALGRLRSRAAREDDWLLGALLLMVLPLSVSRGKLDYYLLPLLPVAAVVVAQTLCERWGRTERWVARAATGAAAMALIALAAIQARTPLPWQPALPWRVVATVAGVVLVIALGNAAWRASRERVVATLAIATAVTFALLSFLWLPAFGHGQPNEAVVADVARERRGKSAARLVVCEDPARVHRDIIFSTRIETMDLCEMWSITATRRPYLMLLDEKEWASLWRIRWFRLAGAYEYLPVSALGTEAILAPPTPRRLFLVANFEPSDPEGRRRQVEWRRERRRALREEYRERLRRERRERSTER